MMILAFFLLGGLAGIFAWLYIDHFIPNLQQEIYQNYIELYPENRPTYTLPVFIFPGAIRRTSRVFNSDDFSKFRKCG